MKQELLELISPTAVKICEKMPPSLIFLRKNGCCRIPKADCEYLRYNLSRDIQVCSKDTHTSLPITRIAV